MSLRPSGSAPVPPIRPNSANKSRRATRVSNPQNAYGLGEDSLGVGNPTGGYPCACCPCSPSHTNALHCRFSPCNAGSRPVPAPTAAGNLVPVRPKSLPGSRRTSSAGVHTKRPGRQRASSVSVRGMASPDLLKGNKSSYGGSSAENSPVQQQRRRVSMGGPTAGSITRGGIAMKVSARS